MFADWKGADQVLMLPFLYTVHRIWPVVGYNDVEPTYVSQFINFTCAIHSN